MESQSSFGYLPKSLMKRYLELQQLSDRQKEEKQEQGSAQQEVNHFLDTFRVKVLELNETMNIMDEGNVNKNDLSDYFDKITKEIQLLNRYLATSSGFLKNYYTKKCQETLDELQLACLMLEEKLLPKKKFGFKAKKNNALSHNKNQEIIKEDCDKDAVDGEVNTNVEWKDKIKLNKCGFFSRIGEILKLSQGEVKDKDIELADLDDCTIILFGTPNTLHITNVKRCKIFSGPVCTSVFLQNCSDGILVFPCQQLRIHSTKSTKFYVHITSRIIIEDTKDVQFAPFNWTYEGIENHFKESGLNIDVNNWQSIDDFNWLVHNVQSPNWSIINSCDRVNDWEINIKD